ncbi:MAG: TonB-dependent receptor [Pseudomonadota bacterium]
MIRNATDRVGRTILCAVSAIAMASHAAPALAQNEERLQISIEAQPLGAALLVISDRYDVSIIVPDELTRGLSAPTISGDLTAEQALERVLEGSGLTVKRSSSGAFVVTQDGSKANDYEDDAIIVTATKLQSSIQDTEASVEVFDQERLDREEIVDLLDLILRIPNVSAGSGQGNDFSIRGIGRNGATGAGGGVASNVYVDGAPLSGGALLRGPLSLWDIGQVEVLRGPISSVQGRNALAGGIFVSTADPTYDFEGKVRATYGRFNEVQLAAALSGPIIEDQIAARIAVDYQTSDGFIQNVTVGQPANDRESLLIRGKLLIEPKALPGFSTKFTVDYIDAVVGGPAPIIFSGLAVTDPAFQDFDFFDFETFGAFPQNSTESLRIVNETVYEFTENWLVRSILTYEDTNIIRGIGLLDDEPLSPSFTRNRVDPEIFSAETRIEFNYDKIRGFVGGYYFEDNGRTRNFIQNGLSGINPLFAAANPADSFITATSFGGSNAENFAVFGQAEWDIDEHWRLNFGFRYDNERIGGFGSGLVVDVEPDNCEVSLPGAIFGAPVPFIDVACQTVLDQLFGTAGPGETEINEGPSDRFEAFLPRAAITYSFDDDHSIFLSFQRGYRAGGSQFVLAPTNVPGVNENILNTFDPEFLDTIEIGTRNVLLNGQLTINGNIFYSKYRDQITQLNGPIQEVDGLDDFLANAGESTLYGAEFTIDYNLDKNWNFFASIGLLETEFDDFEFASTGDFQNLAGNEFPFAPNLTFTFTTNYKHESGFYASGTLTYTGSQFTDPTNLASEDFEQAFADAGLDPNFGATLTEEVEDWSDITLRAGFRKGNFDVFAAVTNLLDVEQLRSRSFGIVNTQTGAIMLDQGVVGLVVPPRSFRIGVDFSF